MQYTAIDSSASAVVLADYGRTKIDYLPNRGFQLVFTRHCRIKVFTSSGYEQADVMVPLYRDGGDREKISQIKGYTYNLENGKVVKTKLKKNGKFLEEYDEEKSKNSADINLLLIAMLREAGIESHPVVLSTRSNGVLRKAFPMLNQFNYVVAMAISEEGNIIMDATDAACPPGVLPVRCLNQEGRIVLKRN